MNRHERTMFGGLFLGWGAASVPVILLYAPLTYWWSGAAWGGLASVLVGLALLVQDIRKGEEVCPESGRASQ